MSIYDRGGPRGGPPDDEDNEDFGEMLRQTRDRARRYSASSFSALSSRSCCG